MSKIFITKTKDNEVSNISDVIVESVESVEQKQQLSLKALDDEISKNQAWIDERTELIQSLRLIRDSVLIEAEKIKLKPASIEE